MKFFCEYCGNMVDANKDTNCPNCGASYKKNKSYIKLQEEKTKEEEQNKKFKQQIINHTLSTIKFSRWIILVPIIIFIIVFSIIIFSFININKGIKNDSNEIKNEVESIFDSAIEQIKTEEEKVTVGFNEYGATKKYKVKATKYEVVEDTFKEAEEGYELVKFHFIVENLTDYSIRRENVNCIVDGIAQKNDSYSGNSDLPFYIDKELAVKGTAKFFVPKDATSYDLRYGDYITIHIEK